MRRRLSPEVRRAQILDAALAVFAERGYAAARMEDIGQRCELSKSGLYAHFTGKEEVFAALLTRAGGAGPGPPASSPATERRATGGLASGAAL